MEMEGLYSKLYDKYIKLKTKKVSDLEKLHRDQEEKFMTYVAAADELIYHLKSENERLHAQVNDLRSEVASIRSAKDKQQSENEKLLMEENQKNKELAEEIKRLKNQQEEGPCYANGTYEIENGQQNKPGGSQVGSEGSSGFSVMMRKRSRYSGTETEVKQTISSGTLLKIDQPKCCSRKIGSSGCDVNVAGPTTCMFQELIECLVGMNLFVIQSDEICISAVHQSSGYSFSLTWTDNSEGEAELLYSVLSLGTFERVAPEWMREVLMFSFRMCPIFFQRVSRVIKLY